MEEAAETRTDISQALGAGQKDVRKVPEEVPPKGTLADCRCQTPLLSSLPLPETVYLPATHPPTKSFGVVVIGQNALVAKLFAR